VGGQSNTLSWKHTLFRCKLQAEGSSLNRYTSEYQASFRRKQNHIVREKDDDAILVTFDAIHHTSRN
jgi:hypothetical protein